MREPETTLLKTGAKIAEIRPNQRAVYLIVFALGIPAMLSLLALLAGLAILGCAMDVVMVYSLRRFGGDLWVMDHPSEPGLDIVESQHE